MARQRKQIVKDRAHFATLLAKMEGKKSQVKIGDIREILKIVVKFDASLTIAGHKSALMMLRREAALIAKQRRKNVRNSRSQRSKKSYR